MRLLVNVLFFTFIIFNTQTIFAQNSDVQKLEVTLRNQSDAWINAILTKNREALEAQMDERFIMIDVDGRAVDKKNFINNITSADLVIEPYNFETFKMRFYGNTAIINAANNMRGTYKGNPFIRHYQYTDVFVKEGDVWRVVSVQATLIK